MSNNKIDQILKESKSGEISEEEVENQNNVTIKYYSDNEIERYNISNKKFNGYILEIKDPTQIKVGYTKKIGKVREKTSEIAQDNKAIAAINGKTVSVDSVGLNPRTAIGQKSDGTVVMLVINGIRGVQLGASLKEVQTILLYEDRSSNRIRGKGYGVIATGENAEHYLLNTDNNYRIYIGNGKNNMINKIFVADLTKQRSSWRIYNLSGYISKKDIYILGDGRMYINNSSKNIITEVATGKLIQYKGQLVKVCNHGLISRTDNEILGSLLN